ncbi:hypothetical protein AALO_G00289630 [Alosa alosa]|uniref:Uncharacterized protein n=1 Tax=Alosa alosa TaxID=278164 RepID=A0AAV6FNB1_9TELE|nr:hypothetical protein AALO_G00289630 [Alosa alosa]
MATTVMRDKVIGVQVVSNDEGEGRRDRLPIRDRAMIHLRGDRASELFTPFLLALSTPATRCPRPHAPGSGDFPRWEEVCLWQPWQPP